MTAYFDAKHAQVAAIRNTLMREGSRHTDKALDAIDAAVVYDVSVCAEMPEFPPHVRERIAKVILARSAACQPVNGRGIDVDSQEERASLLDSLIWDLHTVFHDVAELRLPEFGDDPRMPLRALYGRAEELREELAAVENPFELWLTHSGDSVLFRAHNVHIPMLGPGARRLTAYPVASLEEAIAKRQTRWGLPPVEDMETAADAERDKISKILDAWRPT